MTHNIIEALQWRYATKHYDTEKKLEEDKLHTILEAWRLAPSRANTQPRTFVVVSNPEIKKELGEHSGNAQVVECSHLIVICAITDFNTDYINKHIEHTAQTRDKDISAVEWYKKMLLGMEKTQDKWLKHNPFIALGTMICAAAELRVDSSPMWGFDREWFTKVLQLEEKKLTPLVLLGLGYRSKDDKAAERKKVRWDHEDVIIRLD